MAGSGVTVQEWGSDLGSDEPYTVIKTDGRVVLASVVPWDPMESELKWASVSGDVNPEVFVLADGRRAAFGEGAPFGFQPGTAWSDLVIEVGPTEALRISSAGASRGELVDLAGHVTSDGNRAAAPAVKDLPQGYELVGSVEADMLVALRARLYPNVHSAPGPESAYGVGWVDTETKQSGASQGPMKPGKIGPTGPDSSGLLGETSITPAPCLKLSNMKWACPNPQGGGQNGSFGLWNRSDPAFDKVGLPPFAVVTTSLSAAVSVRMTVGDSTSEAALSQVPDGNWDTAKVAVLFAELPVGSVIPSCVTDLPPAPQGIAPARIDLLDASGTPVGCLG